MTAACGRGRKWRAGSPAWDALIAIEYSIQKPRPRHPDAAGEEDRETLKKLQDAAAEEKQQHPDAAIEIWAMDEHSA